MIFIANKIVLLLISMNSKVMFFCISMENIKNFIIKSQRSKKIIIS